jgi:creatinase
MGVSSLPDILRIRNGAKVPGLFSDEEMHGRVRRLRDCMQSEGVDYVLFTSYHNIDYYSGFLYCAFGRSYGLVVGHDDHTTISANIDYGQPWRRSYGDNIAYTDWRRDNFFRAVGELIPDGGTVGVEHDHMSIQNLEKLRQALPATRLVDISAPVMRMRMIKSQEEIEHIAEMARIADIGGAACVEAVAVGTPEYEVARHATSAMEREIAGRFPDAELMDTWTWFQSGINTDGAHNPLTTRRILSGDILSMNCFPMVGGYYVALERTLFAESASDEHLRLWEINCRVHDEGKRLIRPGVRCSQIAHALNGVYEEHGLLEYRTFGYGHSFGVLCHYYGREAGLELREDVDTVLEPGMVVSMEPMITIPEGRPGAGGYREHDVLVVTEDGNRNLTGFPYGPAHNIIG